MKWFFWHGNLLGVLDSIEDLVGTVEAAIHQVVSKRFAKKQQMRWTPLGAHLPLQVRTAELNGDLRGVFERWYPGLVEEALPAA